MKAIDQAYTMLLSLDYESLLDESIPLLAPLVTAERVFVHLDKLVSVPVAFAGALAIELIGFRSMRLQAKMKSHNDSNTNKHERENYTMSTWQVWIIIVLYLVVALFISFFMEIYSGFDSWTIVIFPFLGLTGSWFAAMQKVYTSISNERQENRDKKAKDKKDKKETNALAKVKEKESKPKARQATSASKNNKVTDDDLLKAWRDDPQVPNAELARKFGVTPQAISQRKKKLYTNAG